MKLFSQILWRLFVVQLVFNICIFPMTLLLTNTAEFIMWKNSFYDGLFGIALMTTGFIFRKSLIGLVKPKGIDMSLSMWSRVDIYYSFLFVFLAASNAWVVHYMTVTQWFKFHVFVPFPAIILYTVIVTILVRKDIEGSENKVA